VKVGDGDWKCVCVLWWWGGRGSACLPALPHLFDRGGCDFGDSAGRVGQVLFRSRATGFLLVVRILGR